MSQTKKAKNIDDEYKVAIKPLVDEAMQAHNLAPAMQNAIVENKPLNDEIQKVICEAITRNPDIHDALDKVISDNEVIKKSKVAWKQPSFWIPISISTIISIISVAVAILK